jgi:hypothetical protein
MKAIATALLVVSASAVQAQTIDPTGHWKGTIGIPNNPVDFEVDIARSGGDDLIGTVTAGADRATLPLLKVTLEGPSIVFYGRTDQTFRAEFLPSGKALSGMASLNGYSLPFSMGRTGDARIDPPPTSPAVSTQLEGAWSGTLSAGERRVRLSLTIANQPDGTSLAYSVSVDEGGLTIPTVVSQTGRSVKIETRGVSTLYVATLDEAGTELSGTWTQGATSLPLTMTRVTVERTR